MTFRGRILACLGAGALPLVAMPLAEAAILYSTATRNTTVTADSIAYQPWQYEGQFIDFVGTAIAPNYFITANHIGGASTHKFYFQGSAYSIDPTYGTNGKMQIAGSDLAIWKVTGMLPLYVPLYTSNDEVGKHIVVIGRGTARGADVIVNTKLKGWEWGTNDHVQAWGENDITSIADVGGSVGQAIAFEFNAGSLPNEAMVTGGDSGGGVFIQEDGVWKLAGINYSADGTFSRDSSGSNPFTAALFDMKGLYEQYSDGTWQPTRGPGQAYSSRISTRTGPIYAVVPGAPVVQQTYTVLQSVNMGNVDVAGTTTVGDGTNSIVLGANYIRGNTLSILKNAKVVVNDNGTDSALSTLATLSIDDAGKLDLANNDLLVQGTQANSQAIFDEVYRLVSMGHSDKDHLWQGNGITSRWAQANSATTLAVILNRDTRTGQIVRPTFAGTDVDIYSTLVKYTWNGDMNLDGRVDPDDYFLIDRGFINRMSGFQNGDLNYDGVIDPDDYFLIDEAYIDQNAVMAGGSPVPMPLLVPEPGTSMVLLMAGALAIALRRRVQSGHVEHGPICAARAGRGPDHRRRR